MPQTRCWLVLGIALPLLGGCQPSSTAPRPPAAPPGGQAASPQPRERALAARQEMFEQLSARLMDAMAQGGPAAAISICQQEAPQVALEVGRKHNLAIGRTSFRLRNPGNAPPDWARPLVEQRVEQPQFVDLPNGGVGALLPIRLQPLCLTCHGPPEQLGDGVRQALAEQYPQDAATGFQEGDLRGWFWVEVPDA